jgi:hypothetical protein
VRVSALALLKLFLCLGVAQTTGAGAGVLFIGVLHDVTASEVVLMMGTEQVPLVVTQTTSVTIDGSAASIAELRSGDHVSVLTESGEARTRVATDISARRSLRDEP